MKNALIVIALITTLHARAQDQPKAFTADEINQVANRGSGISGPGKPVEGTGWGDWRDGPTSPPTKRATGRKPYPVVVALTFLRISKATGGGLFLVMIRNRPGVKSLVWCV